MPPRCGRRALGFRVPSSTEGFFHRPTKATTHRNISEHPENSTSKLPTTRQAWSSFCSSNLYKVPKSFCSSTDRVENHKCTFILIALNTACDSRGYPKPIREHGTCFQTAFSTSAAPQTVCPVHECRKKNQTTRTPKRKTQSAPTRHERRTAQECSRCLEEANVYICIYFYMYYLISLETGTNKIRTSKKQSHE